MMTEGEHASWLPTSDSAQLTTAYGARANCVILSHWKAKDCVIEVRGETLRQFMCLVTDHRTLKQVKLKVHRKEQYGRDVVQVQ